MKNKNWILVTGFLYFLFAILPSWAFSSNPEVSKVEFTVSFLLQQDGGKYGKDSAKCIENLSLYKEFYKQWKASDYKNAAIKDAIVPWRWVFLNCPQASQNTFIDGINIMEYNLKNAKTEELKSQYLDTILKIYDERIKYFGREGYVLGRKGSDLSKWAPEDYEKAYHILKKSCDLSGNQSESFVLVYYFRSTTKMIDAGKIDKAVLFDVYDQVMTIINNNLAERKENAVEKAEWENVKGNIELAFEPYATCDDLIEIYTKKFNQTPDDIELLTKITSSLDKKECTDSQLFFDASVKLNELQPSPESSYFVAKLFMKKEKYQESEPYLQQALNIDNNETKSDINLLLSKVYYQIKDYNSARSYARKSIELNPAQGQAYILIGDMYAASAESCGDNDLTKKAAYWAAVDKYMEARKNDPAVDETAQKRIEVYSKQFPGTETIFFYDLKVGDSYTVECWINERTIVRVSK